jgi:hypothetical protein
VAITNGAGAAAAESVSEARDIARSWRDVLPVHPAADLSPLMGEDELRELAADIKKNCLSMPIMTWSADPSVRDGLQKHFEKKTLPKNLYLLDGRNRLDAVELNGVKLVTDDGKFDWYALYDKTVGGLLHISKDNDPYAAAISLNIHRRHLTAEQRRELIAKVLKARPEQSNRQIAKQVKADDKTVAKVRTELQANSDIPNKTERTEASGRKARGRKPKPAQNTKPKAEQKVYDSPQEAHGRATTDISRAVEELLPEMFGGLLTKDDAGNAIVVGRAIDQDDIVDRAIALVEAMDEHQRLRFFDKIQELWPADWRPPS